MKRHIVNPMHFDHLPVQAVEYAPQNLRTIAIQVNNETLGAMAIEFGCEIQYHGNTPYLDALLERINNAGEKVVCSKVLRPGEWLVVLEDEIHMFPHDVFWNTFGQHKVAEHGQFDSLDMDAIANFDPNAAPATNFMNLPVGMTHEGKQLPDVPQIN